MKAPLTPTVVSTCITFPSLPDTLIERNHVISTLDLMFEGGLDVIILEGNEGIGKTTFLAQYITCKSTTSFGSFLNLSSKYGYDPECTLHDLCNQFKNIVYGEDINYNEATDTYFRKMIIELQKRYRRTGEPYNIIIDGLTEIPAEAHSYKKQILDLIPFGIRGFRVLLSGDLESLSELQNRGLKIKAFHMQLFSINETRQYFKDTSLTDPMIEELFRTFKGMPLYYSSVKRIINSGEDPEELINNLPSKLSELFEIEWDRMLSILKDTDISSLVIDALSIVTFDKNIQTYDKINSILEISNGNLDIIKGVFAKFTFLDVPDTDNITYVSESFRRFAENKLRVHKHKVDTAVLKYLLSNPESDISIINTPIYLDRAGNYNELISYLSPIFLNNMIRRSESLLMAKQRMDLGFNASIILDKYKDILRFCMHKSSLLQTDHSSLMKSEMEALLALNDFSSALGLAQTPILKEDRLHMLSLIDKKKRELGLSIEPELYDQIIRLNNEVDHGSLGHRLVDIALDLMYIDINMAMELIEKGLKDDLDERKTDWTYATVAIMAEAKSKDGKLKNYMDQISNKIKNPRTKQILSEVSILLGSYNANEFIRKIDEIENIKDKLLLLQRWCMINRDKEDAINVTEYGLGLAIKTTEFIPNASVYREIATPIPFCNNENKARSIIRSFDGQKEDVKSKGPSEDYVRFQLLLAEWEYLYEYESSRNRAIELYYYISDIRHTVTRASCLARYIGAVSRYDIEMRYESNDKLHTVVMNDLMAAIDNTLVETADHYIATKNIIKALSKNRVEDAFGIIGKVNTQSRRDMLSCDVIEYIPTMSAKCIDIILSRAYYNNILDISLRNMAIVTLCDGLAKLKEDVNVDKNGILSILGNVRAMKDLKNKSYAICHIYKYIYRRKEQYDNSIGDSLLEELERAWNGIDDGIIKIHTGHFIVTYLAGISLDYSKRFLNEITKYKISSNVEVEENDGMYIYSTKLAIRSFHGLLPKHNDTGDDLARLIRYVSEIPSSLQRANLFSELIIRLYTSGRSNECKEILNSHLLPILDGIKEEDQHSMAEIYCDVMPAIYAVHKSTAFQYVARLDTCHKDYALNNICKFILHKVPCTDPCDIIDDQFIDLEFTDIIDLCELIQMLETDANIFYHIKIISATVGSKKGIHKYNRGQRFDIATKIENIINAKLPSKRDIKHDGYVVACLAQVMRIKADSTKGQYEEWMRIYERATNIPNVPDRILVKGMVLSAMPSKYSDVKQRELEKIFEDIKDIEEPFDKIDRLESIFDISLDIDQTIGRRALKRCIDIIRENDELDIKDIQRNIIDKAYRLDPKFAASLIEVYDDDPARQEISRKRIKILEIKAHMSDGTAISEYKDVNDCPQAAWLALGALNADRVETIHIEDTIEKLRIGSRLPIEDAYPIYSYIIENINRRFSTKSDTGARLRDVFEACVLNMELTRLLAEQYSSKKKSQWIIPLGSDSESGIIIRSGEREKAIEFIRNWLDKYSNEYIKISEPYFSLEDLHILKIIKGSNKNVSVHIIVDRKYLQDHGVTKEIGEEFRRYWNIRISDQEPPYSEFTVIDMDKKGPFPIHDRWWVTKGSGIKLGTSFNSIGTNKDSEVSIMGSKEAMEKEDILDMYINRNKKIHNGSRIYYTVITI